MFLNEILIQKNNVGSPDDESVIIQYFMKTTCNTKVYIKVTRLHGLFKEELCANGLTVGYKVASNAST